MSDDPRQPDVADYVGAHAPELDVDEVAAFMREHDKPEHESGFHVEWAVRKLRERRAEQRSDGPSIGEVVNEMRRHDER